MSERRVSIHRPEYNAVVACLVEVRQKAGVSQTVLAARMKRTQGFISFVEAKERRLDLLQAWEWCRACGVGLGDLGKMVDDALRRAGGVATADQKPKPALKKNGTRGRAKTSERRSD